mmetsp:Transcript_121818/g.211530  ORF Transcript_121818/g.211530 Transcript_121818/m.211530 type:complete len:244 (-) Transcript_121818:1735-2466(-)
MRPREHPLPAVLHALAPRLAVAALQPVIVPLPHMVLLPRPVVPLPVLQPQHTAMPTYKVAPAPAGAPRHGISTHPRITRTYGARPLFIMPHRDSGPLGTVASVAPPLVAVELHVQVQLDPQGGVATVQGQCKLPHALLGPLIRTRTPSPAAGTPPSSPVRTHPAPCGAAARPRPYATLPPGSVSHRSSPPTLKLWQRPRRQNATSSWSMRSNASPAASSPVLRMWRHMPYVASVRKTGVPVTW